MPKVGKKHFPYTKKGKEMAKKYAKKNMPMEEMPLGMDKDKKKKKRGKRK